MAPHASSPYEKRSPHFQTYSHAHNHTPHTAQAEAASQSPAAGIPTHDDVDAILSRYDERKQKKKAAKCKAKQAQQLVHTHTHTHTHTHLSIKTGNAFAEQQT